MPERAAIEATRARERAAYNYVCALDEGDLEAAASIVQSAQEDPELGMMLAEIDAAYAEEDVFAPVGADAVLVQDLAFQHLPSAFRSEERWQDAPLTVGDVAARMKTDQSIEPPDAPAAERLLQSSVAVPPRLSARAVDELAQTFGAPASGRFWRAFRDKAIMLALGRSHRQAHLSAAREARWRRAGETHSLAQRLPSADVDRPQGPSSRTGPGGVGAAVARAFADAGLEPASRGPGRVPLDELIRAYPLRMAEVPRLTYAEARRLLDRETGQAMPISPHEERPLAGYLFAYQCGAFLYGCILVKQDDPVERRRFSAAHELGHYLLHFLPLLEQQEREARSEAPFLVEEAVYSNDAAPDELPSGRLAFTRSDNPESLAPPAELDRMEDEANRFAAELLMPAAACQQLAARYRGTFARRPAVLVRRMANDLLVSETAMRRRLADLSLLQNLDSADPPAAGQG
jgi:hypothetical protein